MQTLTNPPLSPTSSYIYKNLMQNDSEMRVRKSGHVPKKQWPTETWIVQEQKVILQISNLFPINTVALVDLSHSIYVKYNWKLGHKL